MKEGDEVCCIAKPILYCCESEYEVGRYYKIDRIFKYWNINYGDCCEIVMNKTTWRFERFNKHFITKKELRKLKLKKLNNIYV
jgi:hypothetical protein